MVTGDPANGTATTGYDPLGRLTGYTLPGVRTLGSSFDAVPNRTTLTTDGVPATATFDARGGRKPRFEDQPGTIG